MKMFGFLLILVIAVGAYCAFQYHFIILDDEVKVLKKLEPSLKYSIVDGRGAANKVKILTNPILLKAGIQDLMSWKEHPSGLKSV